jgi:hypothetical protein
MKETLFWPQAPRGAKRPSASLACPKWRWGSTPFRKR